MFNSGYMIFINCSVVTCRLIKLFETSGERPDGHGPRFRALLWTFACNSYKVDKPRECTYAWVLDEVSVSAIRSAFVVNTAMW